MDIVAADTGSENPAVLALYSALEEKVFLKRDMNYHFGRCNNYLFQRSVTKDKVLFLNNDVIIDDTTESLQVMVRQFGYDDSRGLSSAYMFDHDDRIQHAGISFYFAKDRLLVYVFTRTIGSRSTHLVYSGRTVHLGHVTRQKDSEEWMDRQRFVRKCGAFVEAFVL